MRIISWNVNGIRAIYKKGFADWLKKENADIVCIQESKAEISQFPDELKNMGDYNFYCSWSQRKGYSGVAAWTKENPNSIFTSIEKRIFDCEGRVLRFDFEKFTLFNIYFPNGGSSPERLKYKLDFYDYLIEYLKNFKSKPIIICGDYNTAHFPIDLSRPKENEQNSGFLPAERERLDKLTSLGFTDVFRYFHKEPYKYTWWDYKTFSRERNIGWRIDYFFVSNDCLKDVKTANIESSVLGSDHCPVSITIF
ncbi:MAG: exodeoxyribonuclease III [Elusimicrobiota bacterium]|jgi:exodeoxyribonuclease-3|nr:exodeoxyribonuclease III [Elusimicrobiota bacterium]